MAEGKGFEPPKGISSFNDLANRRLQPLGHPSAGADPFFSNHDASRRLAGPQKIHGVCKGLSSHDRAVCQTGNLAKSAWGEHKIPPLPDRLYPSSLARRT